MTKRWAVFLSVLLAGVWLFAAKGSAEDVPQWVDLFNGKDLTGWVPVNGDPDTWTVKDGIIICKGTPIGVMRSAKQYENFVLHVEWRHMARGGNSGVFAWSSAVPDPKSRLPNGMEIQALDPGWLDMQHEAGKNPTDSYISGELFAVGGVKAVPDFPRDERAERSRSVEMRVKGNQEWNTYDVVAINGSIKLAINGKFVNGISNTTQRKGYLCLESEGSEVHFRNIKIMELLPGAIKPEQIAAELP